MTPDKIEKLCLRARQAIEQRDWEKAKQAYLMALGLKSDAPDIHMGLATVYFQLRELTSAAHHFKEVTRLDPLRAGAYINLGAVLNLLQELDEAIAAIRRGIQLDPQRVEGYYNLGLVNRRKGQIDLAIQAYREAIRLNPRMADAHLNLANLYLDKQ
jgi:tetratricopeptide (TPR) repeat protein